MDDEDDGQNSPEERLAAVAVGRRRFDQWEVGADLRAVSRLDAPRAVELGEEIVRDHPDAAVVATSLAWAHYRRDISPVAGSETIDDQTMQRLRRCLRRIHDLNDGELYGRYSAFPIAVLRVATLTREGRPDYAVKLLSRLDPAELDDTTDDQRFPSPRQRYQVLLAAVLRRLKRWEDTRDAARAGLELTDLHEMAERELLWSLGVALDGLGDPAAIGVLERHLEVRRTWWSLERLATALARHGHHTRALETVRQALDGTRLTHLSRVGGSLLLAAELLADRPDGGGAADGSPDPTELARDHLRLLRWNRAREGWRPKSAAEELARRLGLPADPDDWSRKHAAGVLGRLRDWWAGAGRETGTVRKLINTGSGFIERDRGGDIYFSVRRGDTPPAEGTRVSYRVQEGYDRKKGRKADRAVDVRGERG